MSVVRIFTPPNPMAAMVGGPEDPTVASLARDAEARVAQMRAGLRQFVRDQHRTIARLTAEPEEMVFAEARAVGDAALAICEVAGAAGMEPAGEAARGVYAMVQALVTRGIWHSEALQLHIGALALFNGEDPPPSADCGQILKRLKAMRDWIGVPE